MYAYRVHPEPSKQDAQRHYRLFTRRFSSLLNREVTPRIKQMCGALFLMDATPLETARIMCIPFEVAEKHCTARPTHYEEGDDITEEVKTTHLIQTTKIRLGAAIRDGVLEPLLTTHRIGTADIDLSFLWDEFEVPLISAQYVAPRGNGLLEPVGIPYGSVGLFELIATHQHFGFEAVPNPRDLTKMFHTPQRLGTPISAQAASKLPEWFPLKKFNPKAHPLEEEKFTLTRQIASGMDRNSYERLSTELKKHIPYIPAYESTQKPPFDVPLNVYRKYALAIYCDQFAIDLDQIRDTGTNWTMMSQNNVAYWMQEIIRWYLYDRAKVYYETVGSRSTFFQMRPKENTLQHCQQLLEVYKQVIAYLTNTIKDTGRISIELFLTNPSHVESLMNITRPVHLKGTKTVRQAMKIIGLDLAEFLIEGKDPHSFVDWCTPDKVEELVKAIQGWRTTRAEIKRGKQKIAKRGKRLKRKKKPRPKVLVTKEEWAKMEESKPKQDMSEAQPITRPQHIDKQKEEKKEIRIPTREEVAEMLRQG